MHFMEQNDELAVDDSYSGYFGVDKGFTRLNPGTISPGHKVGCSEHPAATENHVMVRF